MYKVRFELIRRQIKDLCPHIKAFDHCVLSIALNPGMTRSILREVRFHWRCCETFVLATGAGTRHGCLSNSIESRDTDVVVIIQNIIGNCISGT